MAGCITIGSGTRHAHSSTASGARHAHSSGAMPQQRHRAAQRVQTLVVSGGGMKGVASLGAVVALRQAGALDHVRTVVGTSAGALVAAAYATNRANLRVLDTLAQSRYQADVDLSQFLASFGLDSGKHLERWIYTVLGNRAYTFRCIREQHGVDLVVCATNLTDRMPQYFGPDHSPDMDVGTALRMSCTIPLLFSAVKHEGKLYVDGAVADNFPMAWASDAFGAETVLGIAFKPRATDPSRTLEAYVGALLECSTRRHFGAADGRVLLLDTGARSAFEFAMPRRDMRKLYASGARQARDWLKKTL